MIDPEEPTSPRSSDNLSGDNSHIQSEAEVFCRIMERLNAVALGQMKGLLEIAITAAEKIHSVGSADKLTATDRASFINQTKGNLESISHASREALKNVSAPTDKNNHCPAIEQAIHIAIDNSVTNQQQLNVIGASILTSAASLLLGNYSAE